MHWMLHHVENRCDRRIHVFEADVYTIRKWRKMSGNEFHSRPTRRRTSNRQSPSAKQTVDELRGRGSYDRHFCRIKYRITRESRLSPSLAKDCCNISKTEAPSVEWKLTVNLATDKQTYIRTSSSKCQNVKMNGWIGRTDPTTYSEEAHDGLQGTECSRARARAGMFLVDSAKLRRQRSPCHIRHTPTPRRVIATMLWMNEWMNECRLPFENENIYHLPRHLQVFVSGHCSV